MDWVHAPGFMVHWIHDQFLAIGPMIYGHDFMMAEPV
jgi:hypothetical protein